MRLKRFLSIILIMAFVLWLPIRSEAGLDDGLKTVRVGYFQYNHLLEGESETDRKSGYAYDLLQELSSRNQWKYEYVYGTYAELYQMLRKGEIDLLPSTCYTETRAQEILFPDYAINTEVHYLVGRNIGALIDTRTVESLDGARVGAITGSANEELLLDFAAEHGITVDVIEFDKADEIWTALSNGMVDYIAGVDVSAPENTENLFTEVFCTGSLENFIAVAPARFDLLAEMNASMKELHEDDPYRLTKMQEKYFREQKPAKMTASDSEWLNKRGTIRIGALSGNSSLIYRDHFGRYDGPSVRIFDLVKERAGMENSVEWKVYDSADALHVALLCGEVDVVDHTYHDFYEAEHNGRILTDTYASLSMSELRKKDGPSYTESRIAVVGNTVAESYVHDNWPNAEIVVCENLDECIQKLDLDYVECVIDRSDVLSGKDAAGTFYEVNSLYEGCSVCYACRDTDYRLVKILDSGIRGVSESEISGLYNTYQKVQTAGEDAKKFALNHKGTVGIIVAIIVGVLLGVAALFQAIVKYRKITAKNAEYEESLRQINEKNEQLLLKRSAELLEKNKELTKVNDDIVEMLGSVVELRDQESGEHIQRVKTYSHILAEYVMNHYPKYHLSEDDVEAITTASAMHDVGKIQIPDAVLQKPGKLTDEEYAIMKTHAQKGAEILENAPKSWSKDFIELATEICLNHHEKWDGSGYPNKRKGAEIPISAQIVSVSDCFDALTQDRVYRKAIDPETSFQMILDGKCGVFGPDIIECFKACKELFINTVKNPTEISNVRHDAYSMTSTKLTDLKILIVDDDEFSRDLNRDILEEEGAVVTEAVNGKEALAIIKASEPFDAVLMDLVMPEMDGIEATAEIRKYEQTASFTMPIIALTADPREERARRCLEAGANACMAKPLVVSELTTIIITFMKNRSESMERKLEDVIRIANTDPLTKVKSIAAYTDMIAELSEDIKSPDPPSFAIVMCDVNRLKAVNDTYGHDTGDIYIKNAVQVICHVFMSSPVYRIGGDEFVVVLQGIDYSNRNKRFEQLLEKEAEASKLESFAAGKASFAAGMAVFNPEKDYAVSDVVKRADVAMYSNKKSDRR